MVFYLADIDGMLAESAAGGVRWALPKHFCESADVTNCSSRGSGANMSPRAAALPGDNISPSTIPAGPAARTGRRGFAAL